MQSIEIHFRGDLIRFAGDNLAALDRCAMRWYSALKWEPGRPRISKPALPSIDLDVAVDTFEEFISDPHKTKVIVLGEISLGATAVHYAWRHFPMEMAGHSISGIQVSVRSRNVCEVVATYHGKP